MFVRLCRQTSQQAFMLGRQRLPAYRPARSIVRSACRNFSTANARWSSGSIVQQYSLWLETKPLTTKGITGAAISFIADVVAQKSSEDEAHPFSWARTARFTLLGGVMVAPVLHYWYGALVSRIPGMAVAQIAKRLVCDQIIFSPVFTMVFFGSLHTLEGQPSKIIDTLQTSYTSIMISSWMVWVPTQIFNFGFVPQKFQVLFVNCVGLVWNVYLSYAVHAKPAEPPTVEAKP